MASGSSGRSTTSVFRAIYTRISAHLPLSRAWRAVAEFLRAWLWRRPAPAVGTGFRGRISPHFPSKIFRNLPNNPVNLSEFIELFGNSIILNAPSRCAIIRGIFLRPHTANAGNCGADKSRPEGGVVSECVGRLRNPFLFWGVFNKPDEGWAFPLRDTRRQDADGEEELTRGSVGTGPRACPRSLCLS